MDDAGGFCSSNCHSVSAFHGVGWKVFGFLPGYAGEEGFDASGRVFIC
jgi:hypothetical protein